MVAGRNLHVVAYIMNQITAQGGTDNIRGIYLPITHDGRVARVCNCGVCQKERRECGEEPVREMISADLDQTLGYLADCGINLIIASLPREVLFDGLLAMDRPVSSWPRDPVPALVETAHRHGIEVHPVCCWIAGEAPKPQFAMVNADGRTVNYSDPGKPQVREFFMQSALNLLRKYDIDGISLDGTRYAEMELTGDCCYCDTCRSQFKQQYGFDPLEVKHAGVDSRLREQSIATGQYLWNKARQDHVTRLVTELKAEMCRLRPTATLSAYVWGYASRLVFQNWTDWLHDGALDWINPSGYTYPVPDFIRRCKDIASMVNGRRPFAITLGPHTSHGKLPNVEALLKQIAIAKSVGSKDYVLFTHSHQQLIDDLPRLAAAAN